MKKLVIALVIALSAVFGTTLLLPKIVNAANDECHQRDGFLSFPTWYEYLDVGPKYNKENVLVDNCAIIGPTAPVDGKSKEEFSIQKAIPRIALALVDIMLRVAGMVAVGYVIFGGFKFMTSQGEPDATKKAQGTVTNALIGLAIAILATTIVGFVGSKIWLQTPSPISEKEINIPKTDITSTKINDIYSLIFGIAGGIAVIIIIVAGIKFITSQGDPQATAKARNTIIYAAIGLAVSVAAFTIVTFVVGKL